MPHLVECINENEGEEVNLVEDVISGSQTVEQLKTLMKQRAKELKELQQTKVAMKTTLEHADNIHKHLLEQNEKLKQEKLNLQLENACQEKKK